MKAICIDDSPAKTQNCKPKFKYGQVCNVSESPRFKEHYDVVEHLIDDNDGFYIAWSKSRFIPLSDIDERELIEQRENNLVNK